MSDDNNSGPPITGCAAWDPKNTGEYNYQPTLAGGIIFSVLFGGSMLLHIYQSVRKRTWWTLVFAIGALCELMGWAARTASHDCPYNLNAFLMQICTLIFGPTFFTAGIYIILGRLINKMGRQTSPISATTYLWIFCTCDLVALVIQAIGGSMAASAATGASAKSRRGTNIMVGGIDFQLAGLIVFLVFFVIFLKRVSNANIIMSKKVKALIAATTISCVFILIRSIYRTVELLQGWSGYLIAHEPYFIVFDACTMLIAGGIFNFVHPGTFLDDGHKAADQDSSPEGNFSADEEK